MYFKASAINWSEFQQLGSYSCEDIARSVKHLLIVESTMADTSESQKRPRDEGG